MTIGDLLRSTRALVALSGSYVLGPPAAALRSHHGLDALARLPGAAHAAGQLATTGALAAARIARRVRRAPVLRPAPELFARDGFTPVVSLVSDTHITAPGRSVCELEMHPQQWPLGPAPASRQLAAGVARVLAHVGRHAPRTVVWCGDEVDTGDPAEWVVWRAAVEAVPGLSHRLVPGNHDICFNRPFDADYDLARRARRERAFQAQGVRLADFPIVDTIIGEAGPVTLILLDSCRHRSAHVLSNAIGHLGDEQLRELERVLAGVRGPVLCVTHHHVWRDAAFLQPDSWYETMLDADRLVAILAAYRARDARNQVLVCHGHRHIMTAGVVGPAVMPIGVVGLPSSTLGDKSATGRLDGLLRYGIAGLSPDGRWRIALITVGALAIEGHAGAAKRPRTLVAGATACG